MNFKHCMIIGMILIFPLLFYGQQQDDDKVLYQSDNLQLTFKKATYQNTCIYNAYEEEKKIWKQTKESLKSDIKVSIDIIYAPLSLVGNILSYERTHYDFWGSYPSSSSTINTIDVATQKPYSILNLVDEASLLTAIKNDPYVRKSSGVDTLQLQEAETFEDALTLLNDQLQYPSTHFTLFSYAILGYDKTENKLALRLIREKFYTGTFTTFLQLGLKVTPNKGFVEKLKQNDNFYMCTFQGGVLESHSCFPSKH